MSKIAADHLKKSITKMLTQRKQRKFIQTVQLQIALRDIDLKKRFSGSIKLPNPHHKTFKFCVIGSVAHCEQAKKLGIDTIDADGLKAFNKDKKKIKKWALAYDQLLASQSLIKVITKLTDKTLVRIDRFPISIGQNQKLAGKMEDLKNTVKFQLQKTVCMGTAVGIADQTEDQLRQNINMAINYLVSLLPRGWMNLKSLFIKTTMSPSVKLYG